MNERPDRLDTGIFIPERSQKLRPPRRMPQCYSGGPVPDDNAITIGFDVSGDYTEVALDYVAKRVETIRGVSYYVLVSTSGHDIGHMVNPVGIYFDKAALQKNDTQRGRGRYEFKQVPESAFRDYLRFLNTKTESYLRNAERQLLDA